MGHSTGWICSVCGRHFQVRGGGGFFFDLLHCEACGRARTVTHEHLGDIHLAFVKGLPGPYAVSRTKMDREIRETYPGQPLTPAEYHGAAEATLDPCECGGRFRYDAPARCPTCRSTAESWTVDPAAASMFYD